MFLKSLYWPTQQYKLQMAQAACHRTVQTT